MMHSAYLPETVRRRELIHVLPGDIQIIFNLFVFFLAFPAITFFDISITFWIFLILAYKIRSHYGYLFKVNYAVEYLLIIFPVIALISLLVSPKLPGVTLFGDLKIWLQYVYWIVLSLFLIAYGRYIRWKSCLKYMFWGINSLIFVYYLIGLSFDFGVLTIDLNIPRNAFLFQLLCLVPFALLFCYLHFGKKTFFAFSLFYLYVGWVTQGRAGSILLFFEIVVLMIVVTKDVWYSFRFILVPLLLLFFIFIVVTVSDDKINQVVAEKVEPVNLRLANLIRGEEDGDLSEDESWLIRQLMIIKAREIFQDYPYFGIGINHFTKYNSELSALTDYEFREFRNKPKDFFNTRSAHNSYFQVLAEVGALGLIDIVLIFALIALRFIKVLLTRLNYQVFFSISCAAILGHFYVISSITGAVTWFIVGVSFFALSEGHKSLYLHLKNST